VGTAKPSRVLAVLKANASSKTQARVIMQHGEFGSRTVPAVTPAERQLTLRFRTKSLQHGSRQFRAKKLPSRDMDDQTACALCVVR
jgi:hypothetical protein